MIKNIFILLLVSLMGIPVSLGFGLDFLSLFQNEDNQMEPIAITDSTGKRVKTFYSTMPDINRQVVENIVKVHLNDQNAYPDGKRHVPIYLCPTPCLSCNDSNSINLKTCHPIFLGLLYPVNISGYTFYFTARHIFTGKNLFGTILIESQFNQNEYEILELQGNLETTVIFEDLLIFIPRSFISNQCKQNTYSSILDQKCVSEIKDTILDNFISPNNKSLWIGIQPNMLEMKKENIQEQKSENSIPFLYSAGMISSIKLYKDKILNTPSPLMNNYLTLERNLSNHSTHGASGSLINELITTNNEYNEMDSKIGKFIGIVLCNKTHGVNTFSIALNIKQTLNHPWQFKIVTIEELAKQEDQKIPFIYFNSEMGKCFPIDGRGAGGE